MADIRESIRSLFFHGVEAVNSAASSVAKSTQQKVEEMNLKNRQRELMNEVSKLVRSLWQSGVELPDELMDLMEDIAKVEDELLEMKEAAKAAAEAAKAEKAAAKAAKAAKPVEAEALVDEAVEADEIVVEEQTDAVPVLEILEEAPYAEASEELAEEVPEEEPVDDAFASFHEKFTEEDKE